MASHSVDRYAIYLYPEPHHTYIYLYEGHEYWGYARFFPDGTALPSNVEHSNGIINVHMHASKLASVIDILRNEKPVYLFFKTAAVSGIRTGQEPVGEEEAPPS